DGVLDGPVPPIPLAPDLHTTPAMPVAAHAPEPLSAHVPHAVPLSEERHEDPLDLAGIGSVIEKSHRTPPAPTVSKAAPGIFEADGLSIPLEDAPSVPLAGPPPTRKPRTAPPPADIAAVAATGTGTREISLPISLDIGGKSIRFQLKVQLDLSSTP